jgi:hypothetical protein
VDIGAATFRAFSNEMNWACIAGKAAIKATMDKSAFRMMVQVVRFALTSAGS